MRLRQLIIYAAGWAGLTVLAAFAVWWGLRPLLSSSIDTAPVNAAPPAATGAPLALPSPVPSSHSSSSSTRPAARPSPRASSLDGWEVINGSFVRTFEVTGGTATVRITAGTVELVSAVPRDGYTITPEQAGPQRLVLKFFKPGAAYTVVDAMWWENRPYAEVTVG